MANPEVRFGPEELRSVVRSFIARRLHPLEAKVDADDRLPENVFRDLVATSRELGLYGYNIPEEYGGGGFSYREQIVVAHELGTTTMALGEAVGKLPEIIRCAREDQKAWFSFPCARGEKFCCYAITEPSGGSELTNTRTRGEKVDGGWILTGSKVFISHADRADFITVLAVTDEAPSSLRERFSVFIVEKGTKGLGIGRPMRKMGWRAYSVTDVAFDACFIPDDHVLGQVGSGFEYMMGTVNAARTMIGARCAGIIGEAMRIGTEYAVERSAGGGRLADQQAIQFYLADMDVDYHCTWLLVERAAELGDAQSPEFRIAASRAKLFGSEACGRATDRLVQILGGSGFMAEYPAERMFRDARAYRIGEGTSEIQRLQIARDVIRRFSSPGTSPNGPGPRS